MLWYNSDTSPMLYRTAPGALDILVLTKPFVEFLPALAFQVQIDIMIVNRDKFIVTIEYVLVYVFKLKVGHVIEVLAFKDMLVWDSL